MKQCPACRQYADNEASVCPHCTRDIPADVQPLNGWIALRNAILFFAVLFGLFVAWIEWMG